MNKPTSRKRSSNKPASAKMIYIILLLAVVITGIIIIRYTKDAPGPSAVDADHRTKEYGNVTFLSPEGEKITELLVEIAEDEYAQVTGLMFREDLTESQGMIFVYPDEDLRYFWMKNTPKSLDMIFVNGDLTIVNIEKYTTPMSEQLYPSRKPARYVIETVAGYTDQYDIRIGSRIRWKSGSN